MAETSENRVTRRSDMEGEYVAKLKCLRCFSCLYENNDSESILTCFLMVEVREYIYTDDVYAHNTTKNEGLFSSTNRPYCKYCKQEKTSGIAPLAIRVYPDSPTKEDGYSLRPREYYFRPEWRIDPTKGFSVGSGCASIWGQW